MAQEKKEEKPLKTPAKAVPSTAKAKSTTAKANRATAEESGAAKAKALLLAGTKAFVGFCRRVKKAIQQGLKSASWKQYFRPVVVLAFICGTAAFLLAITHAATQPLIESSAQALAQEARKALLPAADAFDEIPFASTHVQVRHLHKAQNGAGFVVEAFGHGYAGEVPLQLGLDASGNITGVHFLPNQETPGLGAKLATEPHFAAQFVGLPADDILATSVDALAGATLSSNAAVQGINAALALYREQILGSSSALTPQQMLASLLPKAGKITELSLSLAQVRRAYQGDDGNFIIVTETQGVKKKPLVAAVALSPEGSVLALWLDTSQESPGYGTELARNKAFLDAFVGQSAPAKVDAVAGVTLSSQAAQDAVNVALSALPAAKEAA